MASRAPVSDLTKTTLLDGNVARRLALATEATESAAQRPPLRHLLGETRYLMEPCLRPFRKIKVEPTNSPKIVMVLPGFFTGPGRMGYLARHLERAGHKAKRWGLGMNLGPTPENLKELEQRLLAVHHRYQVPVVLLGWSLGGLFAREIAKRQPQCVSKVITMGSPFSGNPRANNAWRLYQLVAGHRVDSPPVENDVAEKPPVETVALWSARDGIISPRSARGFPYERDHAIALRCTHMGFSHSQEAVSVVLRELERD